MKYVLRHVIQMRIVGVLVDALKDASVQVGKFCGKEDVLMRQIVQVCIVYVSFVYLIYGLHDHGCHIAMVACNIT